MVKVITIQNCSECKAHDDSEMWSMFTGIHSSISIVHKCRLNGCILENFPIIPLSCQLEDAQ